MKLLYSYLQEQIAQLDQVNQVAYMQSQGYEPSFSNKEITIFALPVNASGEIIITINNLSNRIESVRMSSDGNILDLASLLFNVSREQVLADLSAYGLERGSFRGTDDVNPAPPTS